VTPYFLSCGVDVEPIFLFPLQHNMVHYRAEAHTLTHPPGVYLLGIWDDLTLAQQSCHEHSEARPHLTWKRPYNGLWEAQGKIHCYQIILILGPLA